jgi:hypothetical protein
MFLKYKTMNFETLWIEIECKDNAFFLKRKILSGKILLFHENFVPLHPQNRGLGRNFCKNNLYTLFN